MDDDDDMDVVASGRLGHCLSWWENDGDENFTQHDISTNSLFEERCSVELRFLC